MKKLPINGSEFELPFDNDSYEINYYLDSGSGEFTSVSSEALEKIEDIRAERYKKNGQVPEDLAATISSLGLPAWQQEDLLTAERIIGDASGRYINLPKRSSREDYQIMRDFIYTVEDERLADRLLEAISGRGAFRYFKGVLYDHPEERERWFAYRAKRLQEEMLEWLEDSDIEPLIRPDSLP